MKRRLHALTVPLTLVALSACSTGESSTTSTGDTATFIDDAATSLDGFTLSSPAVVDGELLAEFQCEERVDGIEASIPLSWSGVPDGTRSLAVTMHHYPDPEDTSSVSGYLALWGIDPAVTEIGYGEADDGAWYIGSNKDGNALSYTSPCSPSVGSHEYTLTLSALSSDPVEGGLLPAESSLGVDYAALRAAVDGAGVIAEATLTFDSTTGTTTETDPVTDTDAVAGGATDTAAFDVCANLDATFGPVSDVATAACDDTYLNIFTETGLPSAGSGEGDERIMVGIESWIQRVVVPYAYDWQVPLDPSWTSTTTEASPRGPIAVAIDGVPIFHYERRPDVSTAASNYAAENDTVLAGELDQCGGHAGQGDDYHYHYAPICLLDEHDLTQPIAFGLDGAPVFFGQGGTDYYGGGRFDDWDNFPAGLTPDDLDECNAVLQDDGSYAHYSTKTPPYLIGCHHAPFDTALQIEPAPMTGREQGTATPLGGQYGEPVTTLMTDFSDDGNGQYTLAFDALDGSGGTSAIIYGDVSTSDAESCWTFEYRADENVAGEVSTGCRADSGAGTPTDGVQFEHGHVH